MAHEAADADLCQPADGPRKMVRVDSEPEALSMDDEIMDSWQVSKLDGRAHPIERLGRAERLHQTDDLDRRGHDADLSRGQSRFQQHSPFSGSDRPPGRVHGIGVDGD